MLFLDAATTQTTKKVFFFNQILLCNSVRHAGGHPFSQIWLPRTCVRAFSKYYAGLTGPAKTRYREKVLTCGFDPYMLKKSECIEDLADYPSMEYPDIVNYLVLQTLWITGQQMKAYKSVDA